MLFLVETCSRGFIDSVFSSSQSCLGGSQGEYGRDLFMQQSLVEGVRDLQVI